MKLGVKFKQWYFYLIFLLWVCVYYYHEKYLPDIYAKRCLNKTWNKGLDPTQKHGNEGRFHNIMFIGDPQLIDNHTYPSYNKIFLKIAKHTSDKHLKRNFKSLSKNLKPDSIIFLGDLLDNGRSSSDDYYANEVRRFYSIFKNYNDIPDDNFLTDLPGNHDIGWKSGVKKHSVERFYKNFGKSKLYELSGVLFVPLNTLSLSNDEDEAIYSTPRAMLNEVSTLSKTKPRVLLTHVPLMRPKDADCGPNRESSSFPIAQGYQFQTVLDDGLTREILQKIQPDYIFSGDDHDYCEISHSYVNAKGADCEALEVTVKSISMTMGIDKPAIQLFTIIHETDEIDGSDVIKFQTEICHLPDPYKDIISYAVTAVISGIIIVVSTIYSESKRYWKYRGYSNIYTQNTGQKSWFSSILTYNLFDNEVSKKASPYSAENSITLQNFGSKDEEESASSIDLFSRRSSRQTITNLSKKVSLKNLVMKIAYNIAFELCFFTTLSLFLYYLFL